MLFFNFLFFFNKYLPEDDQQEILSQITSFNTKLDLLNQTHEIEENERERQAVIVAKRNEKFEAIKSKNDDLSLKAERERSIRQDEGARRKLFDKMVMDSPDFLSPVTDVLNNNQGIYCIVTAF